MPVHKGVVVSACLDASVWLVSALMAVCVCGCGSVCDAMCVCDFVLCVCVSTCARMAVAKCK